MNTIDLKKNMKKAEIKLVKPFCKRYFCNNNSDKIYLAPPLSLIILSPVEALTSDFSKL